MTSDRLIQHFHRIADAPGFITRLRQFILDLAVRGKLVPQLSKADKSPEWHEFCAASDARPSVQPAKFPPLGVPRHWRWSALNKAANCRAGQKVTPSAIAGGDWVLDLEDIDGKTGRIVTETKFEDRRSLSTKAAFQAGDVLYGKLRPYLNKVVIAGRTGFCTTEIIPIRTHPFLRSSYLRIFLRSPYFLGYAEKRNYGMKMPRLGTSDLEGAEVPIPPPNEQDCIVAKVEELMGLCDRLEAAQAERAAQRDRLVVASLHSLAGAGVTASSERALFHLRNLPLLAASPEHIRLLRQTILTLAVRGRLVPQDPKDEPAPSFGIIHNLIDGNRIDLQLPGGWSWAKVENVAEARLGKMLDKTKNSGKAYRYLRNTNVHWFDVRTEDLKTLRIEDSEIEKYRLRDGDILICEGGHGIGRTAVWRSSMIDMVFQKALHRVRPGRLLNSDFFAQCVSVYFHAGVLRTYFTGVGIPHFTGKGLSALVFPLPPKAEQDRIVAKVKQLMVLCDRLEAQLTATQTGSRQLLNAVLEDALALQA